MNNDSANPEHGAEQNHLRPHIDLKEARSIAARARQSQEEQEQKTPGRFALKLRRFSRFRCLLWALQIVAVLAVLEQFVVRPWFLARRRARLAETVHRQVVTGRSVTLLGTEAVVLRGLREIIPAFFAPVEGLAAGSLAMRGAQEETSREYRLPVAVTNTINMRFRLIPAGTAVLGSPEGETGRGDCEILHVTAIPVPFYLGECEVTQAQYRAVMSTNPSHFTGEYRPAEEVTWYDCQRFLIALAELEESPLGTYRLPTEAEWEYACRAGTSTAYCFGDSPRRLGEYADYADNNYQGTNEVGKRLPNAFGLFDMHGNVWEWCLDRYHNYPGDETPLADKASWRCIRGGNWYVGAAECRSANRCRLPPASQGNMLGFRVVRTIPEIFGEVAVPPLQEKVEPAESE